VNLDRRLVLEAGAAAMVTSSVTSAAAASPIVMMDATALAAAIAARKLSCAEVMTAYLDHIAAVNPKVNAIVALQERDGLMAQARERDAQLARGERLGPLHGLPHAVKDLSPVKGIRMTMGSPIMKDFIAPADALHVERIRKAGVIFIGKTNTPEFGLGSHTYNPVYGATHNPWNPGLSAGGSTGGGAVGLATRMLPVADGSDYGGSLRNPAGWNNVCGFRTSFGIVPAAGEDVWVPSISVFGPMARNVTDLALLLSVMAGHDPRAPLSPDGDGARFRVNLDADMKGKRIGWLGDYGGWAPYEAGVLDVCQNAMKHFEAIGARVESAVPEGDLDAAWASFITIRQWLQGSNLGVYYGNPKTRALLKPEAIYEIEGGMKLSAFNVTAASAARTRWYNSFRRLFERFDYVVLPTAQTFAFDINEHWPRQIAGHSMQTYHEWMKATCLISQTGCPSLAVPAGFDAKGRAMGIQIVAPIHHEMDCLRLAHAYEQVADWNARLPPTLKP
jgi:amidase